MGAVSTTGALLASDQLNRYRPFGAFGKPAWQSHVQLRAMLLSKLGPRYANYFGRPAHDPDSGELRWTAEVPGAARPWGELSPEEQARLQPARDDIHDKLEGYVRELRAQGGAQPGGAGAYASLLEQAMKVPAQGQFLYAVGDQPVIAFWGFETQSGASVDPAAGVTAVAAAPVAIAAEAPAPRRRPWWWWLLWLLLMLLLLLLALVAMRACAPAPPPLAAPSLPPIPTAPPPPAPLPDPPKPGGPPDTRGLAPGGGLKIPPGALQKGDLSFLEGLWQLGDGPLNAYQNSPNNVVGTDRLTMQFGKGGDGQGYGTERIRRGQATPDCTGSARATTDGTKLYIERGKCEAPDGSSVNGNKMECLIEGNGETVCYVVNHDGHRWKAPLRRLK